MTGKRVDWKALLACGTCCLLLVSCGGCRIQYGIQKEPGHGTYHAYRGRTADGPQWIRFGGVVKMSGKDDNDRFLVAAARIDAHDGAGREVYDIVVIDTQAVKEVGRWLVQHRYTLIDGDAIETLKDESDIGTLRGVSVSGDGGLVALIYSLSNGEYADIEIALWDTATHRRIRRLRRALSEAQKKLLRRYGHKYLTEAGTIFSTDRKYITVEVTWGRDPKSSQPRRYAPMAEEPRTLVATYALSDE